MNPYEAGERTLYEIPAGNYPKFEAAIAKLSKRSEKLIGLPIIPFIFDRYNRDEKDGTKIRVYKVMLTADTPKLGGWEFVARVDHSQETGNILRVVPNTTRKVPERYRTAGSNCEHCNARRKRRDTFIVCHEETGEFKQIGSNCLADFLGHDPYKIARMAEFLSYADETAGGFTGYEGLLDHRYVDLEEYLGHAAAMVRIYGWTSAKAAYEHEGLTSTRERASTNMHAENNPKYDLYFDKVTDEDKATAAEALAWARTFADKSEELTEYEHNVLVIANAALIEYRAMGLAASIVGVHVRNKAKAAGEEEQRVRLKDSQHVGEAKQRLKFGQCKVIGARRVETYYGMTHIYRFLTAEGNVLTWFATSEQKLAEGEVINLTGTVMKHDDYKGVKQTVVNRCKMAA